MQRKNPALYEALQQVFGTVLIAHEGEAAKVDHDVQSVYRGGKVSFRRRTRVKSYGETYRVSCPFCSDLRQRLWIPYIWGEENEETGGDNLHLATCFHNECLRDQDNREALKDMVWPIGRHDPAAAGRTRADHPAEPEAVAPPRVIVMPEGLIPIHELPRRHVAAAYLIRRGFDPDELWSLWRVAYCPSSPDSRPPIHHRVVFPVHGARLQVAFSPCFVPVLEGWQARALGDDPDPGHKKYLSAAGMKKTCALYGLIQAVYSTGPVVVVEGPTDVWRLRTNAVATLGKSVSEHQRNSLCSRFARRPLVVFLDRDAGAQAIELRRSLQVLRAGLGDRAPVVIATPPDGRNDVGESTRQEAWGQVAAALGQPLAALGLDDGPRATADA